LNAFKNNLGLSINLDIHHSKAFSSGLATMVLRIRAVLNLQGTNSLTGESNTTGPTQDPQ
jgi:hypothetical protein